MTYVEIFGSSLHGTMQIPPSKSHTMRALYFAAMASGVSTLYNLLDSPDTHAMIRALTLLGAKIRKKSQSSLFSFDVEVEGVAGNIREISSKNQTLIVDVGNSGQVLRFIAPLICFQNTPMILTGDHSIQSLRSMSALVEPLRKLGATITYCKVNGYAPLSLCGPITQPQVLEVVGPDSQPISSLLMSLGFIQQKGESIIRVRNIGEKPWIEFTLWWLDKIGVVYTRIDEGTFIIPSGQRIASFSYTVPADASSLAFPLGLALITPSSVTLDCVDLDDPQGDRKIVALLEELGAKFSYSKQTCQLHVQGPQTITGAEIDIDYMIDALPIISVIAACSLTHGKMCLYNAFSARNKESDRIDAISSILQQCGFAISATDSEITIFPQKKQQLVEGLILQSRQDHRIAMASIVLSAAIQSSEKKERGIRVGPIECIDKSFPYFLNTLSNLGLRWKQVVK